MTILTALDNPLWASQLKTPGRYPLTTINARGPLDGDGYSGSNDEVKDTVILRTRIAINRLLVQRNFSRYGPPLAAALLAYSERLTFFVPGMPSRIRAVEEAAATYRRLVDTVPGRYEADLGYALVALNTLGQSALDQGKARRSGIFCCALAIVQQPKVPDRRGFAGWEDSVTVRRSR